MTLWDIATTQRYFVAKVTNSEPSLNTLFSENISKGSSGYVFKKSIPLEKKDETKCGEVNQVTVERKFQAKQIEQEQKQNKDLTV